MNVSRRGLFTSAVVAALAGLKTPCFWAYDPMTPTKPPVATECGIATQNITSESAPYLLNHNRCLIPWPSDVLGCPPPYCITISKVMTFPATGTLSYVTADGNHHTEPLCFHPIVSVDAVWCDGKRTA
jgi:hypothetical protein